MATKRRNPGGAWGARGFRDGVNSRSDDAPAAFKKYYKQLPDEPRTGFTQFMLGGKKVGLGTFVTAQENYYVGFQRGREARESKKLNPAPRRKTNAARRKTGATGKAGILVPAKVRVTNGGKSLQILVSPAMARKLNPEDYPIGIPRYNFDPRKGDVFFVEGKRVTVSKVAGDMVHISPSVHGTSAMSVGNLYQVAKVPATSRFAPYDVRRRNKR